MTPFLRKINFLFCVSIIYLFYTNGWQKGMSYTISTLWDNTSVPNDQTIDLKLQFIHNNKGNKDLEIRVLSPFYDDPKIPGNASIGSMDQLWNYEVFEVFLLGEDNHYLEIELGPKGQYLLLQLHGYRNVTKQGLTLSQYSSHISHNRWTGIAVIPFNYLPKNITKFNAYAIHGSGTKRQYMSLFATPFGKYSEPDFHRLEYFGDFELKFN